jgi:hypothetical protein
MEIVLRAKILYRKLFILYRGMLMRSLAAQASGAFYVDLNAIAADRYDALGQQASAEMFSDVQHTKRAGAKINAESAIAGLKQLNNCPLVAYLAAPQF